MTQCDSLNAKRNVRRASNNVHLAKRNSRGEYRRIRVTPSPSTRHLRGSTSTYTQTYRIPMHKDSRANPPVAYTHATSVELRRETNEDPHFSPRSRLRCPGDRTTQMRIDLDCEGGRGFAFPVTRQSPSDVSDYRRLFFYLEF